MSLRRYRTAFDRLDADRLAAWSKLPTAAVSDCLNRSQTLSAEIKPVAPGMRLCGQARTVASMVGDNSAAHVALRFIAPGEILVIAAGGYTNTAVWGGLMTEAALVAKIGGIVVDGAIRDVAEIRASGLACFAAAAVPAGPHKGFGGTIDGAIACAGCPVQPGDIILGDDDGVTVVPLADEAEVFAAATAKVDQEHAALEKLKSGVSLAEQMGLDEPEIVS